MPWNIKKEGKKWCVFREDTGEKEGCSDSKEKATAHMRLLYAKKKD